jgi:hypothetical protein
MAPAWACAAPASTPPLRPPEPVAVVAGPAAPPNPPPPAPPLAPATTDGAVAELADPACTLRDARGGQRAPSIVLRFHGRPFAEITRPTSEVEIRLGAGGAGGTAHITTDDVALSGEVRLEDLRVRPRDASLYDDWLALEAVRPTTVSQRSPQLSVAAAPLLTSSPAD